MMSSLSVPLRYKPELGKKTDFGIGIVGAGAIVEAAHLPAYRKAHFNIVGIFDEKFERARYLSDRFAIPKIFQSLDDLVADPSIAIVDIAVPPSFVSGIAIKAFQARKHVLSQKPLASSFSEAKLLVEQATRSKRQLV